MCGVSDAVEGYVNLAVGEGVSWEVDANSVKCLSLCFIDCHAEA